MACYVKSTRHSSFMSTYFGSVQKARSQRNDGSSLPQYPITVGGGELYHLKHSTIIVYRPWLLLKIWIPHVTLVLCLQAAGPTPSLPVNTMWTGAERPARRRRARHPNVPRIVRLGIHQATSRTSTLVWKMCIWMVDQQLRKRPLYNVPTIYFYKTSRRGVQLITFVL